LIRRPFPKRTAKARFHLRKSSLCLSLLGLLVFLMGLMFIHAYGQHKADGPYIKRMSDVVRSLELTDLCLFTEARYTRHLSQADLHSAFQDHPLSLEHFPAGSVTGPPAGLRKLHGKLD
jgi:hypothetical protein